MYLPMTADLVSKISGLENTSIQRKTCDNIDHEHDSTGPDREGEAQAGFAPAREAVHEVERAKRRAMWPSRM
jgi:hypothetical protein